MKISSRQNKFGAVVAVAALTLSACSSGHSNPIVGRWEAEGTPIKMAAEFHGDGTGAMSMMGQTVRGTYKVTDGELEWTVGNITGKHRIAISGDELEVSDDDHHTIRYRRK